MSDKPEHDPHAPSGDPVRVSDQALANLMGLDADEAQWSPEDLAAIFQHQMRSLLRYDLVEAGVISQAQLDLACQRAAGPLATFEDLFSHPAPPEEVVAAVQRFGKVMALTAERAIPPQVARVLYFAAIAAARARYGRVTSRLSEKQLRAGLEWGLGRAWVTGPVREIFGLAMKGS